MTTADLTFESSTSITKLAQHEYMQETFLNINFAKLRTVNANSYR